MRRRAIARSRRKKRAPVRASALREALAAVLHVGLRPVASRCGLGVPLAARILPLDGLGVSGHALLRGGGLGGRERALVGRIGFREHAIDGIGPTAVMTDDL